jgi:broad specificity phosphatase PhoE
MDPHTTTIVLVRHGETEYNRTNRYMGRRVEGFNDLGHRLAALAASRLAADGPFDALVASPLRRTRETAGHIERALGIPVIPDEGFLEVDMGAWEGRDRAEVEAEDPERWAVWITDPGRVQVEGMENIDDLLVRVGTALDAIVEGYPGKRVIVVTHYACVATAVLHVLGLPGSAYRQFPVGNASLTEVRLGRLNKLERFNEAAHLRDPL